MAGRHRATRRRLEGLIPVQVRSIPFTAGPVDALPVKREREVRARKPTSDDDTPLEGLYIISVAARILEMHPQTLRKYERVGLVSPSRTLGMLRLYSERDIIRLRLIKHLVDDLHMNLAGVEFALEIVNRLVEVSQRIAELAIEQGLREMLSRELEAALELLGVALPRSRPQESPGGGGE